MTGSSAVRAARTVGLPVVGSCHGHAVASELSFALLRDPLDPPSGQALVIDRADAEVSEPSERPLITWTPTPEKPFSARLHPATGGFILWVDGLGAFVIDPERRRVTVPVDRWGPRCEARLWGLPSVLASLGHDDVSLHAAAIEIDGRAVLLSAPGRHGKTTLAAAFHRAGHRVLSEDLCRIAVGGDPVVFPAAAMLRLRPDMRRAFGSLPETEVVLEDEDRTHLALGRAGRGTSAGVPIAAIVVLDAGPVPELVRLPPPQAIPELWSLSFHLPTDADRQRCFLGLGAIAAAVPVHRYARPLTFASLPEAVDRIVATCLT
jgi:hypothetical protein